MKKSLKCVIRVFLFLLTGFVSKFGSDDDEAHGRIQLLGPERVIVIFGF